MLGIIVITIREIFGKIHALVTSSILPNNFSVCVYQPIHNYWSVETLGYYRGTNMGSTRPFFIRPHRLYRRSIISGACVFSQYDTTTANNTAISTMIADDRYNPFCHTFIQCV